MWGGGRRRTGHTTQSIHIEGWVGWDGVGWGGGGTRHTTHNCWYSGKDIPAKEVTQECEYIKLNTAHQPTTSQQQRTVRNTHYTPSRQQGGRHVHPTVVHGCTGSMQQPAHRDEGAVHMHAHPHTLKEDTSPPPTHPQEETPPPPPPPPSLPHRDEGSPAPAQLLQGALAQCPNGAAVGVQEPGGRGGGCGWVGGQQGEWRVAGGRTGGMGRNGKGCVGCQEPAGHCGSEYLNLDAVALPSSSSLQFP